MEITYAGRWLIYSWSRFDANRNNTLIHPEDLADAEQNEEGRGIATKYVNGRRDHESFPNRFYPVSIQ